MQGRSLPLITSLGLGSLREHVLSVVTPEKSLWFLPPRRLLRSIVQLVTANTEHLRHQCEPFPPAESVQWQNLVEDFLCPPPACLWWSGQAWSPLPAFGLTSYWFLLGEFTLSVTGWVKCKGKRMCEINAAHELWPRSLYFAVPMTA